MPGTEMKVMVEVSVATMEAPTAHHGTLWPARKERAVHCCRRPNHAPAATTATRYPAMMTRSMTDKRCDCTHRRAGVLAGRTGGVRPPPAPQSNRDAHTLQLSAVIVALSLIRTYRAFASLCRCMSVHDFALHRG